jgi:Uma2 family endonuclease
LYVYGQQHPAGKCLIETVFEEYLRTSANRRRADRVLWVEHSGRRPDPKTDPPTIVVEFVSAGKAAWQRDYVEKRDEYLQASVVEYWVIDRFRRSLTVFSQECGHPAERVIRETEVYRPILLPGFELPFAELLAAADRWNESDPPRID